MEALEPCTALAWGDRRWSAVLEWVVPTAVPSVAALVVVEEWEVDVWVAAVVVVMVVGVDVDCRRQMGQTKVMIINKPIRSNPNQT